MGFTIVSACMIALSMLPLPTRAVSYDCSNIVSNKTKFDLQPLAGQHSVYLLQKTATGATENTTFLLDLCNNLSLDKVASDACPSGTRVCAEKRIYKDDDKGEPEPEDRWAIAGFFEHRDGKSMDPKWERLEGSSPGDSERKGLRLDIQGGTHKADNNKPQRAYIDLLCNKDQTGLKHLRNEAQKRDSEDNDAPEEPTGPLRVVKYSDEVEGKTVYGLLHLSWETKYACEGEAEKETGSEVHWGFFTWFILIVFLALAAYLVFGAWLNYNRYGARGWDLMPHGDTIRDIPYILKDWGHRLMSSVQGSGSRGGYSAI